VGCDSHLRVSGPVAEFIEGIIDVRAITKQIYKAAIFIYSILLFVLAPVLGNPFFIKASTHS
jgi:hypothetical protein